MGFRIVPNACGSGGSSATYTKIEVDNLVNNKVSKTGDTMTGSLAFAAADIGIERKSPDGSIWQERVNDTGALINTK